MRLHLFNPENDLALAFSRPEFLPPQRIVKMAADLSFLPAWWAKQGDAVWVDRVGVAQNHADQFAPYFEQITWLEGKEVAQATTVLPWGWSRYLANRLQQQGISPNALLSADQIERIRQLSSRLTAAKLLGRLVDHEEKRREQIGHFQRCGEVVACQSEAEVAHAVCARPRTLLKAPWSGSGKGLRQGVGRYEMPLSGWCLNTLQAQGCVMVEPLYTRLFDFAMLFELNEMGEVSYLGLSLFTTTSRGSYEGNLVATETHKATLLSAYLPPDAQQELIDELVGHLGELLGGQYCGVVGVDMMICQTEEGIAVHPCVEINVRQTMGHVALRLGSILPADKQAYFSIVYEKEPGKLLERANLAATQRVWQEGELHEGTLWLTPIAGDTQFAAKLEIMEKG